MLRLYQRLAAHLRSCVGPFHLDSLRTKIRDGMGSCGTIFWTTKLFALEEHDGRVGMDTTF